jgi:hypothetical protein
MYTTHSSRLLLFPNQIILCSICTYLLPFVVADSIPHMVSLDPGKSVRGTAKVFYGAEGWSLKSPGTYKITATYKGLVSKPDKIFTSNIAEIKIRAPENDQEKDQVNLIMGDEQGKLLLFEGGDHSYSLILSYALNQFVKK